MTFVMTPGWVRSGDFLDAVATILEKLPEVRTTNGLCMIVELRTAAESGQRPMTMGEAHDFLIYHRGISPAGAQKTLQRLAQLQLVIAAPSPCIDNAKDLLASRRLAAAIPIIAKPYTVYRRSDEGDLARKKFDTAYLDAERLDPADSRLAEWLELWRSLKPSPDELPRSLTPFFKSPLAKRASPSITAVVGVTARLPGDFEMLLCDGPALDDPPFAMAARAIFLRRCKSASLGRALKADFEQARLLEEPLFHHLRGIIKGHGHDYFRLILPFSLTRKKVDCLLVVAQLARDRILSGAPPNEP